MPYMCFNPIHKSLLTGRSTDALFTVNWSTIKVVLQYYVSQQN